MKTHRASTEQTTQREQKAAQPDTEAEGVEATSPLARRAASVLGRVQTLADASPKTTQLRSRQALMAQRAATDSSFLDDKNTRFQHTTSASPVQRQILIGKKGSEVARPLKGNIDKLGSYHNLVTESEQQPQTKDSLIAAEALEVLKEWDSSGQFPFTSVQKLFSDAKKAAQERIEQDPTKKNQLHMAEQQIALNLAGHFANNSLHNPSSFLPSTFSQSTGQPQIGGEKGRDDGAFPRTANTLSGALTSTISSPALDLFSQQRDMGNYQQVATKEQLQICPGCRQPQNIYNFEVDHQVAFSTIRDTLFDLSKAMQADAGLEKQIRLQIGSTDFDRYFAHFKMPDKWQTFFPTNQALAEYSNDMSNLMAICRTCNGAAGKGSMDFIAWYRGNPLYGEPFLQVHAPQGSVPQVLGRTANGIGWGEAARAWFEQYHWPILKQKLENARHLALAQDRVDQQVDRSYSSRFTGAPQQQADMDIEAQHLGGINSITTGVIGALVSAVDPERLYPFRPGSPDRLENKMKASIDMAVDERNKAVEEEDVWFDVGRNDALRNQAHVELTKPEKQVAYDRGYSVGQEMIVRRHEQGYLDGVSNRHSVSYRPDEAKPYNTGYLSGQKRRAEVMNAAVNNPTQSPPIGTGEAGAEALLRAFIDALQRGGSS